MAATKLLFFLQLLAIVLRCSAQNAISQLVYDTEGRALSTIKSYFILPAAKHGNGGLKYIPTGLRCLNFVAQERNANLVGTPLLFAPQPPSANASDGDGEAIHLSSDVSIEFHDLGTFCADRLDWHLTDHSPPSSSSPSPRRQLVATGNEDGIGSYKVFQIRRHAAAAGAAGYKLAYSMMGFLTGEDVNEAFRLGFRAQERSCRRTSPHIIGSCSPEM